MISANKEEQASLQENSVRKGLLTVLEAAHYLNLSRSMIYNLMESGRLRYVKIGSARRVPKTCCAELIESHLIGGWNLPGGGGNFK